MDDTIDTPSTNGDNGFALSRIEEQAPTRDRKGRFMPGNPGGPGNPQAHGVATYRKALANSISADDIALVAKRLVDAAKAGKPWAIRELLDRCMGKPHVQVGVSMEDNFKAQSDYTAEEATECRRIADFLINDGAGRFHQIQNHSADE